MAGERLVAIVEAARKGDRAAFGRIVQAFQRMVFGYAYALLGDFRLAEEVAQDAFLEAYRSLASLRDEAAFPGWLKRIVAHCASRARRRERRGLERLDDRAALDSASSIASRSDPRQEETRQDVREAIGTLSRAQREVTTLFYIDGYSQQEIAEFLDVPVNTVKSRLQRALAILRGRLASLEESGNG